MGNCFGKSSSSSGDKFKGTGRTVGSTAVVEQPSSASVPSGTVTAKSQGRTLGPSLGDSIEDPRGAAARAAEERAQANRGKGKLGKQLDAQKARTQSDHLAQVSMENRAAREADAAGEIRAYS